MRGTAPSERPFTGRGRGLLGTSVSVVIPTLNEAENIGWTLDRIPSWVSEVLLIDGLSSDGTIEIARAHRPDIVVVEERTRGKGAALRAGFAAARSDIIVMIDADGSTNPKEMIRFVYALLAGADFVKGSREARGGGSVDITRMRGLGNRFFVGLVNLLHNRGFTDLCYGYCAFWKRHLPALELSANGFEIETELILNAARAGLEIVEVPSLELERRAGASNLSAWRDGLRVLRTIVIKHLPWIRHLPDPAGADAEVAECDPAPPLEWPLSRGVQLPASATAPEALAP